jgi:hypothetical protein
VRPALRPCPGPPSRRPRLEPARQGSDEFTRFALKDAAVNKKLIEDTGITVD